MYNLGRSNKQKGIGDFWKAKWGLTRRARGCVVRVLVERVGNLQNENSTTGKVKPNPSDVGGGRVPLLEKREKWGTPFFFSTTLPSAGYGCRWWPPCRYN
jgi:hypothetical protein